MTQNLPNKILVIKLGALGDFIQALGPMKAIRAFHPDARITLLTTKPFEEIAKKSGYFNDIIIDKRPKFFQLFDWINLRKTLNNGNFSRVYDLQNNDRTNIYFKLFSPKPEWVGVAEGASHRNTSPDRIAGLAFDGHVQTLGLAGINNIAIDTMDWIEDETAGFKLSSSYALIVPGSAPSRPEKRWPAAYYAALCQSLAAQNIQPVILGTNDEQDITNQIAANCPHAVNLTGKTNLFDIVALARKAKLAVGNDTGPMHMIAPTGCPTIVLFSKNSNPKRHAPLGSDVHTIQKDNLEDLKPEEILEKINSL
ncbi:MAG TPA: glycosyltransferase family 9 protein [Alphaproteobacteria bacterium]|nr:glycosyltransferase family 9 protein [Alphaproteobacteria bacterium]